MENLIRNFVAFLMIVNFSGFEIDAQKIASNLAIKERLDLVLSDYMIQNNIKGISASVNIGKEKVWQGAFGYSYDTIKLHPLSLLGIGSITKTYTSTIILQLFEEGKLHLNDPLSKWLPNFENVNSSITIRQLLNHTSGIYNYTENSAIWDEAIRQPAKNWLPVEIMSFIRASYFSPGTNFRYSNSNYILLGMIIEKVTGNSFSYELKKRIFTPLNHNMSFIDTEDTLFKKLSHVWVGNTDNSNTNNTVSFFSMAWSAGGIISIATELSDFFSQLFYFKSLLADKTINEMTKIERNNYGLAIMVSNYQRNGGTTKTFGHGGAIGFMSGASYIPEDSVSIGVICNQNNNVFPNLVPILYTAVINEAPDDIIFSTDLLSVKAIPNTVIGSFFASDINNHPLGNYKYSLVTGDGINDADNKYFNITGNRLILNSEIGNNFKNELHFLVKLDDSFGGSLVKSFSLHFENTSASFEDKVSFKKINLYPNPSRDVLFLDVLTHDINSTYLILDGLGNIVKNGIIINNSINISELKPGFYYLRFNVNNQLITKSFIVSD